MCRTASGVKQRGNRREVSGRTPGAHRATSLTSLLQGSNPLEFHLAGPICFLQRERGLSIMNNIVWLVGAVVIVLFILGYLGLR